MITVEYNTLTRKASVIVPCGDMMPGTSAQIILLRNKYLSAVNTFINMAWDNDISLAKVIYAVNTFINIARDNAKEINNNNINVKFESDLFKAVKAKLDQENNKILIDFDYIG